MASLNLTDYPQTIMVSGKKSRFCDDTNEGVLLYYHKIPGTYSPIMKESEYTLVSLSSKEPDYEISEKTTNVVKQMEEAQEWAEDNDKDEVILTKSFHKDDVEIADRSFDHSDDTNSLTQPEGIYYFDGYIYDEDSAWKVISKPSWLDKYYKCSFDSYIPQGNSEVYDMSEEDKKEEIDDRNVLLKLLFPRNNITETIDTSDYKE